MPSASVQHQQDPVCLHVDSVQKTSLRKVLGSIIFDPKLQSRYDVALTEMETSSIITEVRPEEISVLYLEFYLSQRQW